MYQILKFEKKKKFFSWKIFIHVPVYRSWCAVHGTCATNLSLHWNLSITFFIKFKLYWHHSSIIDIQCFRRADYDNDQYFMVPEKWKWLPVCKEAKLKFDRERLHTKKLKNMELKEMYQARIWNRFANSKSMGEKTVINCENTRQNIKSVYTITN